MNMFRDIRQLIRHTLESMMIFLPGLVIEFDHQSRRARVQLKMTKRLNRGETELDGPKPYNRPDVHYRSKTFLERFPYDNETPAVLGFWQREGDHLVKDDELHAPESSRTQHPQDAILMGNVKADNEPPDPSNFKDDWIWVNRETGHYIAFTREGDIFLYGRRVCTWSDGVPCPTSPPPLD